MNKRKPKNRPKPGKKNLRIKPASDILLTRDFSSVEDAPNSFDLIKNIANRAGKNAAAEAKAAGLPQIFARNNQIIQKKPNGEEEVISTAETSPLKLASFYIRYKPSTILHVRKK